MQVSLQPCNPLGVTTGSATNLEVASFDEERRAKLKTYDRVQAFSDVALLVGAFNRSFTLSIIVPQDFASGEDIETLLAGMQAQDQMLVDVEGRMRQVRISQIGTAHMGGQPEYYEANVALTAINNTVIQLPVFDPDFSGGLSLGSLLYVKPENNLNTFPFGAQFQRKGFYANGLWWIFYPTTSYLYDLQLHYATSADHFAWSAPTSLGFTIYSSSGVPASYGYDIRFDGTNFIIIYQASDLHVYYRVGTPNANGTITWAVAGPQSVAWQDPSIVGIAEDTNGYPWLVISNPYGSGPATVYQGGTHVSAGSWTTASTHTLPTPYFNEVYFGNCLLPLPGGGMAVTFVDGSKKVNVEYWNGTSWSTPPTASVNAMGYAFTGYTKDVQMLSAVAVDTVVHMVWNTNSPYNMVYARFDTSTNAFIEETILRTTNNQTARATLSKDSDGNIYLFYPVSVDNAIYSFTRNALLGAWYTGPVMYPPVVNIYPSATFLTDDRLTITETNDGGAFMVAFETHDTSYSDNKHSFLWLGFVSLQS